MNLRKRLLLISTLIFGLVFTLSAVIVYSAFYKSSERTIYKEMDYTALLTAYFYLEEDEMTKKEHSRIRIEFLQKIGSSKVKLYNEENRFVYGDSTTGKSQFIDSEILNRTRELGKIQFKRGNTFFYGIHYPDNQGDFVVFVISENEFFHTQSNQLLGIIILSLSIGLILIFVLSYYLSDFAYQPINKITNEIEQIDINSPEKSILSIPETKDEIQKLALKFNELFVRLSENFSVRKNFINYLSHEIKTPLASIQGNLEVFGQRERSAEEYRKLSQTTVGNVNEIENILSNLRILTDLENKKPEYSRFRLDESVWSVLDRIGFKIPEFSELIHIEFNTQNHKLLEVRGNKTQIEIALYNLIENALKYSDRETVRITVDENDQKLQLRISDSGRGIPAIELKAVHQPFFRGSNVGTTKGSGIGLPLAVLILRQHNIGFDIKSEIGIGTIITMNFQNPND